MIEDPIFPSSRLYTCRDNVPGRLTHRENFRAAYAVGASIYVLKEKKSISSSFRTRRNAALLHQGRRNPYKILLVQGCPFTLFPAIRKTTASTMMLNFIPESMMFFSPLIVI
jgi:hypothetical protein